jgi:predicted regulator of Ras-like GTPase activity (Roadblock/LC7/MglB family)
MIYQSILESLVSSRGGFHAAVLLDKEGETVVSAHKNGDAHSHRVLGAYQGIYLRELARALSRCSLGDVRYFSIELPDSRIFTETLEDGYYVVLVAELSEPAGIARRRLARAARDLREAL